MEHKDLAKEYALAKLQGKLNGNEPIFSENIVFTDKDIEFAFNAGRESVVENTTKLIWEDKGRGPIAKTIFNLSYIICNSGSVNLPYTFLFGVKSSTRWYKTMKEAMQAANEDYKQRIKKALRL